MDVCVLTFSRYDGLEVRFLLVFFYGYCLFDDV